jgi:hypothetical protein
VGVLVALDSARAWAIPVGAGVAFVLFAALGVAGLVRMDVALALAIVSVLVLLAFIGLRPLVDGQATASGWPLVVGLVVVWLLACYAPFHARLFPGTPLLEGVQVTAAGGGLPLRIPARGHGQIDLLLEGKLPPPVAGGVAPPMHFTLTLEAEGESPRTVSGVFEDTLRTQRLGRRGSTVVHQLHTADRRVVSNPGGNDLSITQLVLEPAGSQAISVTAYAHPLPGPFLLALAVVALLGAVVAFDRLGPVPETDGSLTLATAAVVGTAIIFWTNNAIHPDFRMLIGSVILGGPLGFAAGGAVWWLAKRLIVRPTR